MRVPVFFTFVFFVFGFGVGADSRSHAADFRIVDNDQTLAIFKGDAPVLTYQKAVLPPPAGVDKVFRRSGFIHPMHTPAGVLATEIHPRDHYHHFGLWHAWVHTRFDGKEVDFWNLKSRTGRIRFSKIIDTDASGDQARFCVEQEHLAFPDSDNETVVLRERLEITVREDGGVYLIDYDVTQQNVAEQPIEFLKHRYGGMIALRGPSHWDRDNSRLVTSEGHDRNNGNGKPARWAVFAGPVSAESESTISIAMLGHDDNWNSPQRTRIWSDRIHRGAAFFLFVPTVNRALTLNPNEEVRMRYRLMLADETLERERIETAFLKFNETP